ncbi:MAG: hypothetical protein GC201_03505 [Alphaproteobacteria bacterium]|nr:hypothetical protein [Alphaproteobacteria bacterium]
MSHRFVLPPWQYRPTSRVTRGRSVRNAVAAMACAASLLAATQVAARDQLVYSGGVYRCACNVTDASREEFKKGKYCSCGGKSQQVIQKGQTKSFKARCSGSYSYTRDDKSCKAAGAESRDDFQKKCLLQGGNQILEFKEQGGGKDKTNITCATDKGPKLYSDRMFTTECTNWSTDKSKTVNFVVVCAPSNQN